MKHVALIVASCKVIGATSEAIWYKDGNASRCELRSGATFPCHSWAEFQELCEDAPYFDEL